MGKLGTVVQALFVSESWIGWPFKVVFTLLSFVTLPFGAFLWPALVTHGTNVLTARTGRQIADGLGLSDAPRLCGTQGGFVVDKANAQLLLFTCFGERWNLPFEQVDSWEWQWIDRNGVHTENKIVFKTRIEEIPAWTVGEFAREAAEHWHQRLSLVLDVSSRQPAPE